MENRRKKTKEISYILSKRLSCVSLNCSIRILNKGRTSSRLEVTQKQCDTFCF